MTIYLSLLIVFIMLLSSVFLNISIVWPLGAGLIIFLLLAYKQGFSPKELWEMSYTGVKKTRLIYFLLLFIGPTTSLWMASGTIPFLINSGISLISPSTFVLAAFFGTLGVALLFGSAFATVGTIGVVFMAIARTGHVNESIVAGAIIAAAYMGERYTPVSTTLNLMTIITKTNIYDNIKRLFRSSFVPLLITIAVYTTLSLLNPISGNVVDSTAVLSKNFQLGILCGIPALIVILLACLRLDVRVILGTSMVSAFFVGYFYQHVSLLDLLRTMLFGFHPVNDVTLASMLHGGGIVSIIKSFFIVFIASAYGGIFQYTGMLQSFQNLIRKISTNYSLFSGTLFTSIVSCCFGCSQTFGIVTTHQFLEDQYESTYSKKEDSDKELLQDLGNSAMMVAPLLPWNISSAFPAAVLAASFGFLPFLTFLWITPIYNLFMRKKKLSV